MPVEDLQFDDLPSVRQVIATYRLTARKSLGQNFMTNPGLARRIVRAAGPLDAVTVLEIGPGPGALTRALLTEGARCVIAIEKDTRFLEGLDILSCRAGNRLKVIPGDALDLDLPAELVPDRPVRVVANLPYNIATPLLLKFVGGPCFYDNLILMFQREVAQRLTARPGTRQYGRLSVAVQWRHDVRSLFHVSPSAFTPSPKVWSTLVSVTPRNQPRGRADRAALEVVTRAAFGHRRKMLRSALTDLFTDPEEVLTACGIEPTARAETLEIEDYCALARALARSARRTRANRDVL